MQKLLDYDKAECLTKKSLHAKDSHSHNLLESRNFFFSATDATRTTLGIIQLCFNYFRGILAYTLPGKQSKEMLR